ncbi:MAG: ribokinase [Cypionkella sp.]|nr:ribokinase [Cypionkella sp.]
MKTIVILGIFVADTTFRAPRLPRIGETILGSGFALGPGGKGSNQAVAAARAGGDVHFITRLGRDDFAKIAHSVWSKAGVNPAVIEDEGSYTGAAMIFVDAVSGDNAIIVSPGAAGRISPADVAAQEALIARAGLFMTQLEQPLPAAEAGLALARKHGVMTILNPAPAADLNDTMLALCDLITPNETEAEALTGIAVTDRASAEAAAAALIARGAGAVVLTLGEKGVLYRGTKGTLHVPAFNAGPVVETTGAGDAFNAGLAVALAEGREIEAALRFGCAVAGLSVTRAGAAASMPARAEIDALLARA